MPSRFPAPSPRVRSVALVATILATAGGLAGWKAAAAQRSDAAAANQPEPVEVVTGAVAARHAHQNAATAIGTVLATRSVTLRNEIPGTVRYVNLTSGRIVERGAVLVALDVSVEEAELSALEAEAELARATLERIERMHQRRAASAIELDRARAERDVAVAQIARTRAVIERKTIRAPFRARVGIGDVHPGQFLEAGTLLTTLQGVDDESHVDFAVAQDVAARLRAGDTVQVRRSDSPDATVTARVVAVDARVDPATRNATVRARIGREAGDLLSPGASVRVRVPVGQPHEAVAVPVAALRKGPGGDHVFVLETAEGQTRARARLVQAGPVIGQQVVILDGVDAGEQVAVSGSFKLRDAALVQVAEAPVATAASR